MPLEGAGSGVDAKALIMSTSVYISADVAFLLEWDNITDDEVNHTPTMALYSAAEHGVVDPFITTIGVRKTILSCP